ncbi:hypothetical protein CANINC_001230 [Pichia inconspicua]|uniref:Uncharacterized protein n=1 Tax=Pichia inconspicua TaxID=52247 RepID=A0A4T0X4P3_9ASCO|nr:hypothetical protein CANINC_001230 [[Candida] inconspicua]
MARVTGTDKEKANELGKIQSAIDDGSSAFSNISTPNIKLTLDTTGVDHHQHKHTQSVERVSSPYRNRSSTDDEDNRYSTIDNLLDTREAEKRETLAKQRDHYLNSDTRPITVSNSANTNSSSNFMLFFKLTSSLYKDIDSHSERLYYVFTLELFCIFITLTQYPYLDQWNRFLTPIFTGCQTSLLGETLREIYAWRRMRLVLLD